MGLFSKNNDSNTTKDFSYILDIADIISGGDKKVMKNLKGCISNPEKYAKKINKRYKDFYKSLQKTQIFFEADDIVLDDSSDERICVSALIDELMYGDWVLPLGDDENLDDFLEMFEDTKNYSLIRDTVQETRLDSEKSVINRCHVLNKVLNGRAFICAIKGLDDAVNIFFASNEAYEKLSVISQKHDNLICML